MIEMELEALEEHSKWIRAIKQPMKERPSPMPEPRYKDCHNCPLIEACESETERRSTCAQCPWMALPPGPSLQLMVAMELASLPTEAMAGMIGDLSYYQARDVQSVRRWQASKMMGGFLG